MVNEKCFDFKTKSEDRIYNASLDYDGEGNPFYIIGWREDGKYRSYLCIKKIMDSNLSRGVWIKC